MKCQYFLLIGLIFLCSLTSHADTLDTSPKLIKENVVKIKMHINDQQFEIRLHDNATAKAFFKTLPLQLEMTDLNGNEKFADLHQTLPSTPIRPGTIHMGDLMLYGTKTLVLFYETFESSYRYSPIGKVINPENIHMMMGKNKMLVRFNIEKNS